MQLMNDFLSLKNGISIKSLSSQSLTTCHNNHLQMTNFKINGFLSVLAVNIIFATLSFSLKSQTTVAFNYTGAQQSWTVPAGVTNITIEAWGAQGGDSGICGGTVDFDGGLGGSATGNLAVSPGQVIYVFVGGKPLTNVNGYSAGGFNGGGSSGQYGGGGGGASDVRVGGNTFNNRVIVAGGGGGGNHGCPNHGQGGAGGGLQGAAGISYQNWAAPGGGTQVAGGFGGAMPSQAGNFGTGGGATLGSDYHVGGGGGGWYGGGSSYATGGGGGSSYIVGVIAGSTLSGVQSGNGLVNIIYGQSNAGCTNPAACNYDPNATEDDGSCSLDIDCNGVCAGTWIEDQCGNCYDPDAGGAEDFTLNLAYSGQIVNWTVPAGVTSLTMTANGGQGGGNGGFGARMSGTFTVIPGQVLDILVGQMGMISQNSVGNGGGGGSFIVLSNGTPLLIAGGGGGTAHDQTNGNYQFIGGQTGTSGMVGQFDNAGAGGIAGNGGAEGYTTWGIPNGGGGGGLYTNGGSAGNAHGGLAFENGGTGGPITGGFGGGGGSDLFIYGCGSSPHGGSGGGGYSGGGAGGYNCYGAGGGGGSYNSGTNQNNIAGINSGNGSVTLTYTQAQQPDCIGGCTDPNAPNYNPDADYENGTCATSGCTYEVAINFNAVAVDDDGSCIFIECGDTCPEDINGDGNINTADLLMLLAVFGMSC